MERRNLLKGAILAIVAIVVIAGTIAIVSFFNTPSYGAVPHWIKVENANMECIGKENENWIVNITATLNYSHSYKVDGKDELPLKILMKVETWSNETHWREKVDSKEIFVEIPFHETHDIEENFFVSNGSYTARITVLALKEGRWWGSRWVETGYERIILGPITVE